MMKAHKLKKCSVVVGLISVLPFVAVATEPYDIAVDLLQQNKVAEARSSILLHIDQMPTDARGYLLLAAVEEYNGQYAQAIETLFQGLRAVQEEQYAFYFNIGNNYYALNEYDNSLSAFNQSLSLRADYHPAILNRANVYLKTKSYDNALEQYKYYLSVNPNSYQKVEIEKIISLLQSTLLAEKEQQLLFERREQELLDTALQSLESSEGDGRDVDISIDQILQVDEGVDIVE